MRGQRSDKSSLPSRWLLVPLDDDSSLVAAARFSSVFFSSALGASKDIQCISNRPRGTRQWQLKPRGTAEEQERQRKKPLKGPVSSQKKDVRRTYEGESGSRCKALKLLLGRGTNEIPSGGMVSFISTFLVSTVSSTATLAAVEETREHSQLRTRAGSSRSDRPLNTRHLQNTSTYTEMKDAVRNWTLW